MVFGLGIDLVEIERIKKVQNEKFINRILSEKELGIYNSISHEKRKLEFLAGRFSVKESIFKAYGTSEEKNHNFKDISVLNDINGKPYIEFINHDKYIYHVSITHTDNYASSIVIIEFK